MSENDDEKQKRRSPDPDGSIIPFEHKYRTAQGRTKTETRYYVRKRYTDADGKKREKRRVAKSFNEALTVRRELHDEIKRELENDSNVEEKPKTFNQLADFYIKEYIKPARFAGNEKIEGIRENLSNPIFQINNLREHFGDKPIRKITYNDVREYKLKRLAVPVEKLVKVKIPIDKKTRPKNSRKQHRIEKRLVSTPRAASTVNRELERLRRMFNAAIVRDWLDRNPFSRGDALIKKSGETVRSRILSEDEEIKLLAACSGRRAHLRPIIIFAIDTFMRKAEVFGIRWKDVNLEKRQIVIPKEITKTYCSRIVPVSQRLTDELELIQSKTSPDENDLVFGIQSSAKTSFSNALKKAGIKDFRFHDLRATGITRTLLAGIPPNIVMEFSGHTVWATFQRYIRLTQNTVIDAAAAIDQYYKKAA